MAHQQGRQPSSTKTIERKTIEKDRRIQMKNLCSKLISLIPTIDPEGGTSSRADKIDEAINYIKNLESKVKMAQEKKESLKQRKRSLGECSRASEAPKIEIHEMGSSLQIILTCGVDNQFVFNEVIRILHEDNVDVKGVHSSLSGNSMLHVVHAQIQQSFQAGTTPINETLKGFVSGHRENF